MRYFPGLALAAAASLAAVAPIPDSARRRVVAAQNPEPRRVHSQAREIARRQRQQARLHRKYMLNGGFSRRGNEVGLITA